MSVRNGGNITLPDLSINIASHCLVEERWSYSNSADRSWRTESPLRTLPRIERVGMPLCRTRQKCRVPFERADCSQPGRSRLDLPICTGKRVRLGEWYPTPRQQLPGRTCRNW